MRVGEQADVRLGRVLAISRPEGVETCPVQDDVVALFAGIRENVLGVGTGGARGGVGDEEAEASTKLEVYNRSKRGVTDELLRNGPLLITVVDVRGKGGWSGVLRAVSRG